MLDTQVLDTPYDLAEMSDLQRPNLLDNADFRSGIINQRGFTTETVTGWQKIGTIDRWIFSGAGNAVATLDDTEISISGDSSLIQTLSDIAPIGTYTLATTIESLSGALKVGLTFSDDTSETVDVESTGLFVHTFTTTKTIKSIIFRCNGSGSSFSFSGAKLEKGSIFTGMPTFDYTREILNCQRYFLPLGPGWGNMYQARSDASVHSIYIPTNYPFVRTPSLVAMSDNETNEVYMGGNRTSATEGVFVPCNNFVAYNTQKFTRLEAPLNGTNQIGYGFAVFKSKMALDAEIY